MVRDVLLLGHRQAFCWIDEWINLTIEALREYEKETKIYLDKTLNEEKIISNNKKEFEEKQENIKITK